MLLWPHLVLAQPETSNAIRLKKHERIYLAAYDDTTRALATLFLAKRHRIIGPHTPGEISTINRYAPLHERHLLGEIRTNWIIFGVSAATLTAGLFILSNLTPAPHTANYSYVIPVLGAMGVISSGIILSIQYILLSPYSVKKYFEILQMHQAGVQIPRYYMKRLSRYLI